MTPMRRSGCGHRFAVVAAGFASHLAPFDAFWGQRHATVFDPNGVHIDLFAPLEAA